MVDVQERQRQRYMLLNVLYEANGGAPTLRVDIAPLRDQRGFTQRELWEAMEYAYAFVSESAQWQMTSCADHSRGAGRHCIAAGGTFASDAFSVAGPAAYRSINVSRSARVSSIDVLRSRFRQAYRALQLLDPPGRPYETPPGQ